jgi:hypothetical protein
VFREAMRDTVKRYESIQNCGVLMELG